MNIHTIFLSRRNLRALLSKLDRQLAGDQSACTIVKYQQPTAPDSVPVPYQQTMDACMIVAVEDEEYYGQQNRSAGIMSPEDEVKLHTFTTKPT